MQDDLLAAFPEEVRQAVEFDVWNCHTTPQPLIEPLSERELEVLRLMADGLKYKEIAGTAGDQCEHSAPPYPKYLWQTRGKQPRSGHCTGSGFGTFIGSNQV